MPVTIEPASHPARRWTTAGRVQSAEALLRDSCPSEHGRCKAIIQSSFTGFSAEAPILSSSNGFVRAAVAAYSGHHHLAIRPEDVWFAMLTQLSFFVKAHAEELRSFFVPHAGRKVLEVVAAGNIGCANFGAMAERMTELMAKAVNDPELLPWIMPDFSTTKDTDKVVASILMMGAMQKYFSYRFTLQCGIPSVTLLGERADWEALRQRLEKLPSFGFEPGLFHDLLKPLLSSFVASFDAPSAPSTIDFWNKIAHQAYGSGSCSLSGWITAFCFWDEEGTSMYAAGGTGPCGPVAVQGYRPANAGCHLDGTVYHRVDMDKIPGGFASVPVTVDDNGRLYDTVMVAGSVGIQSTSSGRMLDEQTHHHHASSRTSVRNRPGARRLRNLDGPAAPSGEPGFDSLQPVSGWWMYETVGGGDGTGEPSRGEGPQCSDVDVQDHGRRRKRICTPGDQKPPPQPLPSGRSARRRKGEVAMVSDVMENGRPRGGGVVDPGKK